jgi:hypothetical protein
MARPTCVSEELAQLRNTRQTIFYLAKCIDQRDKDLADQLARVVAGQEALDRKLDHLADLFEQYASGVERTWLESHGSVVQSNEVLRNLRDDVRKAPALIANAVTIAGPAKGCAA